MSIWSVPEVSSIRALLFRTARYIAQMTRGRRIDGHGGRDFASEFLSKSTSMRRVELMATPHLPTSPRRAVIGVVAIRVGKSKAWRGQSGPAREDSEALGWCLRPCQSPRNWRMVQEPLRLHRGNECPRVYGGSPGKPRSRSGSQFGQICFRVQPANRIPANVVNRPGARGFFPVPAGAYFSPRLVPWRGPRSTEDVSAWGAACVVPLGSFAHTHGPREEFN